MYGDVPPDGTTMIDPADCPKQFTSVLVQLEFNATLGCVTVVLEVVVHPFASVAVTVYVPAIRLDAVAVFAPLLQL